MSGYTGLEAKWHDLFWEAEEGADETPLLADFLESVHGETLYVGSGSGRLLGPLVALGHQLTGLEGSAEMAAMSRARFPDARVLPEAWQDHENEQGYAAIVIPAFTFQLFSHPARELERLRQQSERLYLTLFFPWAEVSGDLPANRWYFDREIALPGGGTGLLETRHRLREQNGRLLRKHRYTWKDKTGEVVHREETQQNLRFFTDAVLKKMFATAGWAIEREIVNLGEGDEDDLVDVATFWLRGS